MSGLQEKDSESDHVKGIPPRKLFDFRLGKMIGRRWRGLDSQSWLKYACLASEDLQRYKSQYLAYLEEWRRDSYGSSTTTESTKEAVLPTDPSFEPTRAAMCCTNEKSDQVRDGSQIPKPVAMGHFVDKWKSSPPGDICSNTQTPVEMTPFDPRYEPE